MPMWEICVGYYQGHSTIEESVKPIELVGADSDFRGT